MNRRILGALTLVCAITTNASDPSARTWRLTPDGSGDAPYLAAAMDSAAAGDTVLVAPGEYVIESTIVTDGIVLRSETGPLHTRFTSAVGTSGALVCSGLDEPTEISGIWFQGFPASGFTNGGVISIVHCNQIVVRGCVFVGNNKAGVSIFSESFTQIQSNTFANNTYSIYATLSSGIAFNNIFWDPIYGISALVAFACNDILNLSDLPILSRNGNFSLDPGFCAENNYRLASSSPCVAGNSPFGQACGLIGALPADCQTTSVETRTWGAVKALYRN
jgi:parallel beta-helix repeat protein